MTKKNVFSIMIVCVLIFGVIFIFINKKAHENNNPANVEQYFSEVNIPNLKYSNDKLTYNGNLVKGFFDPIEVAKKNGRYVGFVYSNNDSGDGILLIVRRDEKEKIIGVEEITQKRLTKEVLGN
ncbi:hypothetical protein SAMN00017477_1693 [Peptoniphilus asaccharolyticus DSM 20463]|uniref:Uncharacterized protein n=1 Tax=Peptoniphilus asaccharolyticus DSM 20463 TaxID=573058 RepID=A0A1W1VBV4_PEPAS|nr:hypothetical protein [Peptoniphilus asaccharolyticus]MBL7575650.1 hypothetical protein [Peptoniphilus asaccharolyticus]SMB90805.1 hypothetical protein SAMN00017477_1693 [Peptoniphilus asaccharolyticus DSM 20463]